MPSFLKDLRRRSVRSFRSSDRSSNDQNGSGTSIPTSKSSSTLSSVYQQQTTPPPSLPSENSFTSSKLVNGGPTPVPPLPVRPITTNGHRNSSYGGNGMTSPPPLPPRYQPTSPFAPRITSIENRAKVHQKIVLISGTIGDPDSKALDGHVTLHCEKESFPPTTWFVSESHFKCLVVLEPGVNLLRLDFTSPKISGSSSSIPAHSSWIELFYLPLNSVPPLHLAIILGRDSPGTYDAVPERVEREGNGLDTAVRKFRMAAYLWQAFTAEQMHRNGFGRRCWRYDEEWSPSTLSYVETVAGQFRNEARVHIIRSEKTVAELRDLNIAQQHEPATDKGALFGIAMDAVKKYFKPTPAQKQYVSCMFLDTHWDPDQKVVRGHAALGGGDGEVSLAIFGSHALQNYPGSMEEVVPAFTDSTKTDTSIIANDCNESGTTWEAANIGIGAHLHETGHLFGCPHQESGVMLRDYVTLNRSFTTREGFCTRTNSQGLRVCKKEDECGWHRLDCLRFRFHPCFRQPTDPSPSADDSVQFWKAEHCNMITADTGVAWIELYPQGDDVCHHWIEYLDTRPRLVSVTEKELRSKLPADKRNKSLKLEIFACGGGKHVVEDIGQLNSKQNRLKLPDGRKGWTGSKLGFSQLEGSESQDLILHSAWWEKSPDRKKVLMSIRVYHGFAVDGLEFIYNDDTTQLFGKRGGKPGGDEFKLDTVRGEILMGFYLRAGLWIDGIQILTNRNRKSEIYGNPAGGSGHTLIPPRGYEIAGISGSCGQWLDGFSLIISR
ncbi:jacalin-like lectin domain-containing protein [Phyllosticta paracitricarpa]|uniref:Jacalin-like lectin domain-containing protein n=1 Tax=Phyllosticta paracitricarpa TaxID=2016321 RepID=A0ABR1MYC6_9PEZI